MKEIGTVESVDTGLVIIHVSSDQILNDLQVNQLVSIQSSKAGETIIGTITKISRKFIDSSLEDEEADNPQAENYIRVNMVGTLKDKEGTIKNVFKRTLDTVPSVGAKCSVKEGKEISEFMNFLSSETTNPLTIGKYSISKDAVANLNGNKFFQRHAVIVGGTGSGKSWTVATILEKASALSSVNCIVFDIHGEYTPLKDLPHSSLIKIAGPGDVPSKTNDILFLPYWLFSYEEMVSLLLDKADTNAQNQSRILFDTIFFLKKERATKENAQDVLANLTVESPIPYNIEDLLTKLDAEDTMMVPGAKSDKQGPLFGKLTRLIQRLKSKNDDRRLNFIFSKDQTLQEYHFLDELAKRLLGFGNEHLGLKIIDFSEVPSDILPLVTGLIGRIVFSLQQWMDESKRQPIALFCEEAHLYLPETNTGSMEERGLRNFERIAKEGRKYGVGLVVISQRPADVNRTILSQCGNFVAMRLTNHDDQNVIKSLFPDNIAGFADQLPILDIGEALVVGDASLLPTRVAMNPPSIKPLSATVNFWDEWADANKKGNEEGIEQAVNSLRNQHKQGRMKTQ
jgi:DNA helicase HerA-like ATPase